MRIHNMAMALAMLLLALSCQNSQDTSTDNNQSINSEEVTRWEQTAGRVEIIRDSFGIPHIYAKTDADAVFGMLYAQCEDDFNRVEMNYINAMGRLAEFEGEEAIYRDLRMKLFIDPTVIKDQYESSPAWLKDLMVGFADGINYYLHTHPNITPKVIDRFEPWMALTFSEGSIGGDIETISMNDLKEFYGGENSEESLALLFERRVMKEPVGSNGIAISPEISETGNSLFLINPHTTFFFRSENHVISEEGLNAYGATTWGQFFVYQGFNERLGWMHTSSRADAIDYFRETIVDRNGEYFYRYGEEEREVETKTIAVPYKTEEGQVIREFRVFYTHRGPVIGSDEDGNWISISLMHRPVDALTQSYLRTKAKNYDDFYKTMEIRTNSSNNTVYADADGNIAYFHGNFIPKRDPAFDWSEVVDGSDPATEWGALHQVDEMVMIKNPQNGWIQNCNSTPFTAAGSFSPKVENYRKYMAPDRENFRGMHAVRVLEGKKDWNMEKLIRAAYDPYLTGFEQIVPMLVQAYSTSDQADSKIAELAEPIETLSNWDFATSKKSIPTSLAVYYGQELLRIAFNAEDRGSTSVYDYIIDGTSDEQKIDAFQKGVAKLREDFGDWKIRWGEINRYQRINGEIRQPFNDDMRSLPVGLNSGRWGALASYGSRTYNTKRMYGTGGNSFVAFVEFGDSLRAKSILTGGQSGDPSSPHFDDQALMYTNAEFKDVRFYRQDVLDNAEETYQPGQRKVKR